MSKDREPACWTTHTFPWAGIAVLVTCALAIAWPSMFGGFCETAQIKNSGPNCFEATLNRYQQLIGAIVTLAAAGIAASMVLRQIKATNEATDLTRYQLMLATERGLREELATLNFARDNFFDTARGFSRLLEHIEPTKFDRAEAQSWLSDIERSIDVSHRSLSRLALPTPEDKEMRHELQEMNNVKRVLEAFSNGEDIVEGADSPVPRSAQFADLKLATDVRIRNLQIATNVLVPHIEEVKESIWAIARDLELVTRRTSSNPRHRTAAHL